MAGTPRITLAVVLGGIVAGLVVLQGGIGAVHFAAPWDVLAPLILAAVNAFLGKLVGQQSNASATTAALAEAEAIIAELRDQVSAAQAQLTDAEPSIASPRPPRRR